MQESAKSGSVFFFLRSDSERINNDWPEYINRQASTKYFVPTG